MVENTRELLPEPDTPVKTVRRRFGISTLTSLRLFSRAPCTRIRSWLSAAHGPADPVSVRDAMLIVSPCGYGSRSSGLAASSFLTDLISQGWYSPPGSPLPRNP